MSKEAEKDATNTLEHAYPQPAGNPAPVVNTELETQKQLVGELKNKVKELENENSSLKQKLADVEHEKLVALAEQVADIKVSKGFIKKDKRDEDLKELEKLSMDTLTVLHKELSSIQVKLSEPPKPLSKPTDPPAGEPSPEAKREAELKETRLKLFGHEEPADEFWKKQREEDYKRRVMY